METFNKTQFIDFLAKENGITKKAAAQIVETFVNGIKSCYEKETAVKIPGFANFVLVKKPETKRLVGFTGKVVTVPAHTVYKAKISKSILI